MNWLKRVVFPWWQGIVIGLGVGTLVLLGALEGLERDGLNT